jgi:hypothetical protein
VVALSLVGPSWTLFSSKKLKQTTLSLSPLLYLLPFRSVPFRSKFGITFPFPTLIFNMNLKLIVAATFFALFAIIYSLFDPQYLFTPVHIPGSKDNLHAATLLHVTGAVGPESLVFDSHGEGPYTGVADGRILKWEGEERGWTQFAVTSSNRY